MKTSGENTQGEPRLSTINRRTPLSLMQYGSGVVRLRREKLDIMDRNSKEAMALTQELTSKSDIEALYVLK